MSYFYILAGEKYKVGDLDILAFGTDIENCQFMVYYRVGDSKEKHYILGSAPTTETVTGDEEKNIYYTVVDGDSFWKIANDHGISLQLLHSYNGTNNSTIIHPGDRLIVGKTTESGNQTTTVLHTVPFQKDFNFIFEPSVFLPYFSNGVKEISVSFEAEAYSGDAWVTWESAKVSLEYSDAYKPAVEAISFNHQTPLGGKTEVFIDVSLSTSRGSIKETKIFVDGELLYDYTDGKKSFQFSFYAFTRGPRKIRLEVIDSYGFTASKEYTTPSIDMYVPPKIAVFVLARSGGETNKVIGGQINCSGKGSLRLEIRSKLSNGGESWTKCFEASSYSSFNKSFTLTGSYDIDKAYDFKLTVTDSQGSSQSLFTVSSARTVMSWNKNGVGVGKIIENDGRVLDVNGDSVFKGNIKQNGLFINQYNLLPYGQDLNRLVQHGFYVSGNTASKVEIKNVPEGFENSYFVIEVFASHKTIFQRFTLDPYGTIFMRSKPVFEDTWEPWRRVAWLEGDSEKIHENRYGKYTTASSGLITQYGTLTCTQRSGREWRLDQHLEFPKDFSNTDYSLSLTLNQVSGQNDCFGVPFILSKKASGAEIVIRNRDSKSIEDYISIQIDWIAIGN